MKQQHTAWRSLLRLALLLGALHGGAIRWAIAEESSTAETIQAATPIIDTATSVSEFSWIETLHPPLIYDPLRIAQARDQVKRVGWSVAIIDEQTPAEQSAWRACLKAALFGNTERAQKAVQELANTLAHRADFQSINPYRTLTHILLNYDCLSALPEWAELDADSKAELRNQLREYVSEFFAQRQDDAIPNRLQDRSLRLYAGLITGVTDCTLFALQGPQKDSDFNRIVEEAIMPEGSLRGASPREQIEQGEDWLIACATLKKSNPILFAQIEPYARQSVEWVRDLIYPTGNFPSTVEDRPGLGDLIRYLERGNALFHPAGFDAVLDRLYRDFPRLAQSLLIEKAQETVSTTQKSSSPKTPETPITHVLPQTGAVVLHDVTAAIPLSLYLDTGFFAGKDASALLDLEWTHDLSNPPSNTPKEGTDAFNTVVIDRTSQPAAPRQEDTARNGFVYSAKLFDDGASYIRATASGQYTERAAYPTGSVSTPVLTYERTVFLSSPYAIDLFCVRGGKRHDWIYHAPAAVEQLIHGEWSTYSADLYDYPWMKNSPSQMLGATLKGIYGIQFVARPDTPLRYRLWMLDPAGSQLIATDDRQPATIVARRDMEEDEGDLFAVVHEWYQGTPPPALTIERLTLDAPTNQRGFQAIAFALTQGEETQIFLSSMNPEVVYSCQFGKSQIVFQGSFGHVLLQNGKFQRMRLIGGTQLRYDTHAVQLKSALNFGVVRQVDSNHNAIDIDFSSPLPTQNTLHGDIVTALTTQSAPVMYRPLVIKSATAWEDSHTLHLLHRPNASILRPDLGAPVRTGDQLIFENEAELVEKTENLYSLRYSAPADVMIEGATDKNRVFFTKSTLLRKIRGESTAGVIQLHVEPKEGINGLIEFYRIP